MVKVSRRIIEDIIQEDLRDVENELMILMLNSDSLEIKILDTIKIIIDADDNIKIKNTTVFDEEVSIYDYPLDFWANYGKVLSQELRSRISCDVDKIKNIVGEYINQTRDDLIGEKLNKISIPLMGDDRERNFIISSIIYSNQTLIIEVYDKDIKKKAIKEIYIRFKDSNVNQILGILKTIVKDEDYSWTISM